MGEVLTNRRLFIISLPKYSPDEKISFSYSHLFKLFKLLPGSSVPGWLQKFAGKDQNLSHTGGMPARPLG